jgi:hypothetical protein
VDQATIDGCIAKVDRAYEVLNLLADKWGVFLDMNPWPSWVEHDVETGWHRIYFDFSQPPLPLFSVMVGEMAHDLRSALDHLVWREAVECVGLKKAERNAPVITFPFAKGSAEFKTAPALKYVGADARAILERHQPYKRGKGQGPKSLALLHWFNRMDKHRTVQVTAVGAPTFFSWNHLQITFAKGARITGRQPCLIPGQRLTGHTEVARVRFAADGPEPNVRVQRTPPLNPSFGHPPRPLRGVEISHTITEVRGVITEFAQLLP